MMINQDALQQQDNLFCISEIDSSYIQKDTLILYATKHSKNYKIIYYKQFHSIDTSMTFCINECYNLNIYRYDTIMEYSLGGRIRWHPGSQKTKCWSTSELFICPDDSLSGLYILSTVPPVNRNEK